MNIILKNRSVINTEKSEHDNFLMSEVAEIPIITLQPVGYDISKEINTSLTLSKRLKESNEWNIPEYDGDYTNDIHILFNRIRDSIVDKYKEHKDNLIELNNKITTHLEQGYRNTHIKYKKISDFPGTTYKLNINVPLNTPIINNLISLAHCNDDGYTNIPYIQLQKFIFIYRSRLVKDLTAILNSFTKKSYGYVEFTNINSQTTKYYNKCHSRLYSHSLTEWRNTTNEQCCACTPTVCMYKKEHTFSVTSYSWPMCEVYHCGIECCCCYRCIPAIPSTDIPPPTLTLSITVHLKQIKGAIIKPSTESIDLLPSYNDCTAIDTQPTSNISYNDCTAIDTQPTSNISYNDCTVIDTQPTSNISYV